MSTTDRDLGYKELYRQLQLADRAHVDVGYFEGEEHPDSEYSIPQIAAVHEFGTRPGTEPSIPQRLHLRKTVEDHGAELNELLDEQYERIKAGKLKVAKALTAFGKFAAGEVRQTITDLDAPPKAPATLKSEGKGFTNPLIWQGYMRAAVRSRIVVGGAKRMTAKGAVKGGS